MSKTREAGSFRGKTLSSLMMSLHDLLDAIIGWGTWVFALIVVGLVNLGAENSNS